MIKPTQWSVRPGKTQISLGIRPVRSVFAVRPKQQLVLNYPLSAQQRLIRLGGCPGCSESSLGANVILLVWSWGGSKCCFLETKYAAHMYTSSLFFFFTFRTDRGSYTSGHFIWSLWNKILASFINFIWNDQECKILFTIWPFPTGFYCFLKWTLHATLSRMSLWRYTYAPKCYVTCGHNIFMTWRYPLTNSDVIW